MAKKTIHYVNNKEFLQAIVERKTLIKEAESVGEPPPQITNYLGECILKIANHLSYRPNFINYTYREEMISDGIENCLQYIHNFNPEKSKNPFAYFTQIIYYAFLRRIQKEKKQTHVRNKMIQKREYTSWTVMEGDDTGYNVRGFDPDVMLPEEDIIKTKESKEVKKKGLENFMEDDIDKVAGRGDER